MVIGLLCALATAFAYGTASVLQSIGVTRAGADGAGVGALAGLRSQPLYFVGLALDAVGFVGMVVALQFLPLFLVQAVVAASVAVTAVISAALGTKLGRSGWTALAAVGIGLVLLGLSAASENGQQLAIGWRWVLLASVLPLSLLALVGPRWRPAVSAPVLALGAGLGFTAVAIASRSLALPTAIWRLTLDPAFWVILTSGALAIVLFALALQAGSVTSVSAVTFTTETVIPAAVGLAFLGDAVRDGFWPAAVAGFLLAVGGAVALARFGEGVPTADPGGAAVDAPTATARQTPTGPNPDTG